MRFFLAFQAWLFISWWHHQKLLLERSLPFSPDSVHVMIGVLIQLAAAALLRRSVGSVRPWLVVLVLIVANESGDLLSHLPNLQPKHYAESAQDFLLTMFLPTLLMLTARRFPSLFGPAVKPGGPQAFVRKSGSDESM